MRDFDLVQWLQTMIVLVIAITIHEFAHALATDRCGDPTPRSQGRISLNPIDHLDPLGTLLMAISTATGFGIGWGRPVQYIPANLKHPRWDQLKIAIWGPISNVLQAIVFVLVIRSAYGFHWWEPNSSPDMLCRMGVIVNLSLALFNMIPITPLDGSKVLSSLLPLEHAQTYDRVMSQVGLMLFGILAFTGLFARILGPVAMAIFRILLGEPISS